VATGSNSREPAMRREKVEEREELDGVAVEKEIEKTEGMSESYALNEGRKE
jgi:hypothetical protein